MQTHEDGSHVGEFLRRLKERATQMKQDRASEITGGKDGEKELARWDAEGIQCIHRPEDEQGVLRISVGGGETPVPLNYCVIRGDLGQCIELLEKAARALRAAP